jgi:hypothetical protein
MRFEPCPDSCVRVDLRTTGLLKAFGHAPTLTCAPERLEIGEAAGRAFDVPVSARFRADAIEPPAEIAASDRERMRDHLRGAEVLDAARFPTIELRGRYTGTLEGGRLSGDLVVRGVARPIQMGVRVARDGERLVVAGTWEGKLTDLGIKPFKALLGALTLVDWIRVRMDVRLSFR